MLASTGHFVPVLRLPNHSWEAIGPTADGLRPLQAQQISPHHKEIGQGASDEQAVGVLDQPAIAGLRETKDSFDHQKRMFAPGSAPSTWWCSGPSVSG